MVELVFKSLNPFLASVLGSYALHYNGIQLFLVLTSLISITVLSVVLLSWSFSLFPHLVVMANAYPCILECIPEEDASRVWLPKDPLETSVKHAILGSASERLWFGRLEESLGIGTGTHLAVMVWRALYQDFFMCSLWVQFWGLSLKGSDLVGPKESLGIGTGAHLAVMTLWRALYV